ncbi:MAG: endolytic transglycosylase MltG, partial [Eubacterium sp.]|nr:endolytic transglycosylase MltG [Eubacterium sp.]
MNHKRRKKKKRSGAALIPRIILTVILLAVLAGLGMFYREYSRKTREGTPVTVEIPEGTSTRDLVSLLKEKGVIRYKLPFYLKLYQSGNQGKLRYGSYDLDSGMSLDDLIEVLVRGSREEENHLVLTIPEGFSVEQIGARLEEKGIMTSREFCQAVKDAAADFTFDGDLPGEDTVYFQLQGYLFPDTYYLEEDTTPQQLVAMLLEEFRNRFDEKCLKRTKDLGMTVNEVLTRASLVEKETEKAEEYA